MEINRREMVLVEEAVREINDEVIRELGELELVLVGGGSGDITLA